jgi:hypothetical protein
MTNKSAEIAAKFTADMRILLSEVNIPQGLAAES